LTKSKADFKSWVSSFLEELDVSTLFADETSAPATVINHYFQCLFYVFSICQGIISNPQHCAKRGPEESTISR